MPHNIAVGLTVVCVIAIGVAIVALTPIWDRIASKFKMASTIVPSGGTSARSYNRVLQIKGRLPSKHPPHILDIVLIFFMCLMLAFGGWQIYLWVHGQLHLTVGSLIVFNSIFVALPIWGLVEILWIQRKHYKSGKSAAAKEKDLILLGDINKVFDEVIRVANVMRITPDQIDRPRKFIGYSRKSIFHSTSVINITAKQLRQGRIKIHVLSDAEWVTVKWDIFRHNQRNVDNFVRLMSSESDYSEKSPTGTQTSIPATPDKLKIPSPPQLGILYQKHKIEFDGQVPIITVYAEYRPHGLGEMRIESIELQLLGQRVSCLDWKVEKISQDIWIHSDNKFRLPVGISSGEHDVKLTAFANGEWWSSQPFTITAPEVNS